MQRRTFLAAGTSTLASLAGCGSGDGDGGESYGDWFEGVDNYDGEVDRTGRDRVTVEVGTGDGFAFSPPAIRIDTGTTVVWAWTGSGGRHNVVERDGTFESPYHDQEGATFEHAFDDPGLFPYYCEPHQGLGMKGVVRVE